MIVEWEVVQRLAVTAASNDKEVQLHAATTLTSLLLRKERTPCRLWFRTEQLDSSLAAEEKRFGIFRSEVDATSISSANRRALMVYDLSTLLVLPKLQLKLKI
jgi:hypothetical protein